MVAIDRAGIRRQARALGDEGTNVVLLRSPVRYDPVVLDAALPVDEGESPANGGWFEGPRGPMLLVEGLAPVVDVWLEELAARLGAAGVEGTLTGAGTVGNPLWCQRTDWDQAQMLYGLIGFRPRPGLGYYQGWLPGPAVAAAAVDLGVRWLTAHGGDLVVSARPSFANFRVDAGAAARIMGGDVARTGSAFCQCYQRRRQEVRHVSLSRPATAEFESHAVGLAWRDTVAELRGCLLAAPLEEVSIALLSYRGGTDAFSKMTDAFHGRAYTYHPERWEEFTPEPCALQILTDRHLAAANDLSGWRTTRLDAGHVLVEARDLGPWFEGLRGYRAEPPADLVAQARRDFGAMILTPARAQELGLTAKPPLEH